MVKMAGFKRTTRLVTDRWYRKGRWLGSIWAYRLFKTMKVSSIHPSLRPFTQVAIRTTTSRIRWIRQSVTPLCPKEDKTWALSVNRDQGSTSQGQVRSSCPDCRMQILHPTGSDSRPRALAKETSLGMAKSTSPIWRRQTPLPHPESSVDPSCSGAL